MRRGGAIMDILRTITNEQIKKDIEEFGTGDTVKVHVKIKEGTRERIQIFEGIVIKRQGGGIAETFTVRRIASGVGVERTFPVHSPRIERVEVIRKGKIRKAKIYYLRNRIGRAAFKIKEKKKY